MSTAPLADAGTDAEKARLHSVVEKRGLVGAANNTKWNELITLMRQKADWRPSYRYKSVEGYISSWDVEWWYHLPSYFV